MLFVVQKGFNMVHPIEAEKIVYCVSSVQQILKLKLEFFFTDGHALDRFSSQYTIDDIARIGNVIDWKAVKEKYWNNENDLDLKRRKEAEFLVKGDIPVEAVLGYIVANKSAQDRLINMGVAADKVVTRPNYYF